MILGLLLLLGVALVLLVGGALVSTRSAAGRSLEHELVDGAEREPWATTIDLREPRSADEPVPAGVRAA